MGAVHHLAHARGVPPGPKRKRGGGDGPGDGYDAIVARIWHDPRQTQSSRELLLLIAWLICRDPDKYDDDGNQINTWKRADQILGTVGHGGMERQRIAQLVYDDRPRYEPVRTGDSKCKAPMIRRSGLCGVDSSDVAIQIDPATGWSTFIPYCRRHEEWGQQFRQILRDQPPVEPIPNTGGLMPSYFTLRSGTQGWLRIYQNAAAACRRGYTPPVKYGVTADKWPDPTKPEPVSYPRLRLAALDGTLTDT